MVRNGRQNNRRSTTGRGRARRGFRRIPPTIRAKFDGRKLKPNYDPPSIVENKWNNLVLVLEGNGTGTVPVNELTGNIQDVYGFTMNSQAWMLVRIQRAYVWETTGAVGLSVEFNDLSYPYEDAMIYRPVATITDEPAKNHYACVGYEWPAAQQQVIFNLQQQSAAEILNVAVAGSTAQVLIHLHILWKSNVEEITREKQTFQLRKRARNISEFPEESHSGSDEDSEGEP